MELIDFKILNIAIERLLNKEMAEYGITYAQATVIGYLKQHLKDDIFQKDIEYNLGLTHSTVSILLSRMEEKKMVSIESLASDHRYKKVVLTPKALALSERLHAKIKTITDLLFTDISADELNVMERLMKKMINNINEPV